MTLVKQVSPSIHALILVVERNPAVQQLERFLLEQAGYQVEFASDGLAAFERAKELKPDLVVTEILVPKLDGLSLCHRLKSSPETKAVRVVIFSHLDARDRAQEAGADAFVDKPLEGERLISSVQTLLAQPNRLTANGAAMQVPTETTPNKNEPNENKNDD